MKMERIYDIITALLFMLFLYAGVVKLTTFKDFSKDMANQSVPQSIVPILVYGIPFSEIIAAIFLVTEKTRKWGLYLVFILMVTFSAYVMLIVMKIFTRIPCGCGELIQRLSWTQHLLFNALFTILAFVGILLNNILHKKQKDRGNFRHSHV